MGVSARHLPLGNSNFENVSRPEQKKQTQLSPPSLRLNDDQAMNRTWKRRILDLSTVVQRQASRLPIRIHFRQSAILLLFVTSSTVLYNVPMSSYVEFSEGVFEWKARMQQPSDPPFLTECTGGCLQVTHRNCLGDIVPIRGHDKYQHKWHELAPSESSAVHDSQDTIHARGTVVFFHTDHDNINHIFHDDFWSILTFGSQLSANETLTVAYDTNNSPWILAVMQLAAELYGWKLLDARKTTLTDNEWICTDGALYINGYVRNLRLHRFSELPRIRDDLRRQATTLIETPNTDMVNSTAIKTEKERIVIYSRDDSPYRQMKQTELLIDLFNVDEYDIHIQSKMPESFVEQVEMFAGAALLLAPTGGWVPNLLWMSDAACLVEVHLYDADSWIQYFGLSHLFRPGNFIKVTGNYHDKRATGAKVKRAKRQGGDDEIQSKLLAPDLVRALRKSPNCRRFLRT